MPWVRFTAPFSFHVKPNVTIAYKAGRSYRVKQACADLAIAASKAVSTERPSALKDTRNAGR